jgi:hypothetical protein
MGTAVQASFVPPRETGWLDRRNWDLTFLVLSAVLVPLPFACAWRAAAGVLVAITFLVRAVSGLTPLPVYRNGIGGVDRSAC